MTATHSTSAGVKTKGVPNTSRANPARSRCRKPGALTRAVTSVSGAGAGMVTFPVASVSRAWWTPPARESSTFAPPMGWPWGSSTRMVRSLWVFRRR